MSATGSLSEQGRHVVGREHEHTPAANPWAGAPLSRLAGDKNLLRVLNESALDPSENASASSLDIPAMLTSERMRRRSDISRVRPLDSFSAIQPEAIELPVINERGQGTSTAMRDPGVTFREDAIPAASKGGDPEIVPSFPSSLAPSVLAQSETDSVAPALSPSEKAVYRRKSLTHFLTLCFCVFCMGWNDGTTGPMLPRIQSHYHLGFALVSLVFVFNTIGFITGAMANIYLTDRYGMGKVMIMGTLCQVAAYAMLSPAGPFPLMCAAFVLIGFGLSLQNAHCNGFVASLKRQAHTKMGFLHGSYGLGALISPLVATQFAQSPNHWSFHYLISAGLYISNTFLLWTVFRGRRQQDILEEEGETGNAAENAVDSNKYKQVLGLKEVHILSAFSLIYVGLEVTMGGWSVTYILDRRHGNSNSGYIASGFFGGLMLGRILLLWLNKKIGERLALFLYALLAIFVEVTVWVVPSLIENAIAVSFVGLLLGPMYPILMNHSTTILPRWLLTACMGYIAAIGLAGSAVLPFLTGLLASKFGIASLQPFVVSMMSTLIVIWAVIPRARLVPT
ncbi:MFS general substrate transporter [Trametes coccinea BRFM310]|uniref:MFS general substrate transporter n=1 Tax=Trametes coccinea (strain BRFM310) TaxID=1353009 RepID=A0A1Y2IJT2_TRAC3|nr:MFS general substrate transporter [Trametes coccinea BRFM310]